MPNATPTTPIPSADGTTTSTADRSPAPPGTGGDVRRTARVGGVALLTMAVLAVPAALTVGGVTGDDAAQAARLVERAPLVRLAAVAFVVVAVLDVVVAWALAVVLRPAGGAALLAGWIRLGYAAMLVAAAGHLTSAVRAAEAGVEAVPPLEVAAFGDGWQLALAVFGVHLLVVGALLPRVAPRALGAVVAVAGAAYVVDATMRVLALDTGVAGTVSAVVVGVAGVVGEVWLAGWLLLRAGRR